jgi:arsenite-transporting ATPase
VAVRREIAGPFVPDLPTAVSPLYLFFGGKGGAGKTTCAAAAAILSAERGGRVLVVSTDPAHSLGDVLGRKLTAGVSRIRLPRGSLSACELDADRALTRWLATRRPALAAILKRGTLLDRRDIDPFLDLSLPGVDELLGLLEIERLGQGRHDLIVIDTAPTGHTLRMLSTPATFETLARVFDLMQEKHRVLAAAFARGARRDAAEALIDELRGDGERLGGLLRDRSRTRLCWVTLPEELSLAETVRAVAALRSEDIRVTDVIVNRLTQPPPSPCALCDGRRRAEAEGLRSISTRLRGSGAALWTLAAREEPARGIAALREVARSLSSYERPVVRPRASRAMRRADIAGSGRIALPASVRPSRSTRLLFVGGKGGVGKTTCAAALALTIAREAPERRILLLSTDPAHSIGDVLGQSVGAEERRVRGGPANLVARELDAAREWRRRRDDYREAVARLFDTTGAGPHVELTLDRAIIEEVFDLAPPGMDEVAGMLTMIDALWPDEEMAPASNTKRRARRFDLVIVDTAPTGHAVRLLALPAQAQAWVRQLMTVMLDYKVVGGFEQLARELLTLSRGLERLRDLLADPDACGFFVVTRPERLPTLETIRLIEWLRRHRIATRALIVNGLTPPGCARCRRTAGRERREIASITNQPAWKRVRCPIIQTRLMATPPRGVTLMDLRFVICDL